MSGGAAPVVVVAAVVAVVVVAGLVVAAVVGGAVALMVLAGAGLLVAVPAVGDEVLVAVGAPPSPGTGSTVMVALGGAPAPITVMDVEALPTAPSVLGAVVGVAGPPAADAAPVLVATAIVNGDDSALW